MWLIGSVAGLIHEVLPARQIIEDMVAQAASILKNGQQMVVVAERAKL
jgi:NAD(P)H-dependent flavin oxidoreductase YrpB (nitropropane dioxygenase family)